MIHNHESLPKPPFEQRQPCLRSDGGTLGSTPRLPMRDVWWTKWHWNRFSSE